MEPQRARFVAAFAYILSRVARADMSVIDRRKHRLDDFVSAPLIGHVAHVIDRQAGFAPI